MGTVASVVAAWRFLAPEDVKDLPLSWLGLEFEKLKRELRL